MPVYGENHGVNYNAHATGDVRSGTHVGVVDTGVNDGLRHQQQQYEDEVQLKGPPPGAVLHSQGQLNKKDSTGVTEPLSSTRMFVSGLNFDTDKARIQEICDAFGNVENIHLPTSRDTDMHRGFAFIEFCTESELVACIAALNGAIVDGRRVTAAKARPYQGYPNAAAPHRNRGSSNKTRRVPEESSYEHSSGTVPPPHHIRGGNDYPRQVLEDGYDRSDYSTHRLRMRGRSKSPETLGHEEYPHKRIHMPHVDSTYDNSTGRGGCGGNRDSMLHENYENSQYVPQQQPVPPSPAKKVYVGNLSGRTDFHGLNRLFSRCGRILHIDVKYDQAGIVTPHAVITFAYDSSVSDAVHFYSETELDGHTIVESSSKHCIHPSNGEREPFMIKE